GLDLPLYDLVEAGRVGPELLVAERIVAEDLPALAFEVVARRGLWELPAPDRADRGPEHDQADDQSGWADMN
ncbi:MAG: hypothetical protein M3282_09085, partial [Gemmatimonadota bacterium]|nr:hypothetical protein [Gemmatimonadota bacterium]